MYIMYIVKVVKTNKEDTNDSSFVSNPLLKFITCSFKSTWGTAFFTSLLIWGVVSGSFILKLSLNEGEIIVSELETNWVKNINVANIPKHFFILIW